MAQLNQSENRISQQLRTLTSCSWQEQIEVIRTIKITPQLIKLINHRNYSSELATLFASHNPRSKLITALTDFLLELFAGNSNQLIPFANLLISSECLLRLLASGNKVISSSANQIMKCIIGNIDYKTRGKTVKFVAALEQEFLSSKNIYVREKISLYFLLISTSFYYSSKEALGDFEKKIVKEGLHDACEKVRANMRKILENIHHFQKENDLVDIEKELNRKSTEKLSVKTTKISKASLQNKSLRVLNSSSMNQSSIIENFTEQDLLRPATKDVETQQSFSFYLQRLRTSNTWSMILIAYESMADLVNRGYLRKFADDGLYCQTIKTLTPFLYQKRSKIYESCSDIFCSIFEEAKNNKRDKIISFCQDNVIEIIQNCVKNEHSALKILPMIISLNPSFFIAKISQISTSSKVYKEKCLLLDSIVTNLQKILQQPTTGKGNKRITAMVKAMCFHIESSSLKEKQISLAALAVISQLKSKYSEQVLTALLCQSDKSLTKILQLAESIDPSLKQAIIDYINSFKASNKKTHTSSNNSKDTSDKRYIAQLIQKQISLVTQQKAFNLYKLGELILTHINSVECKQFKKLLSLVEYLCNADLIMEYKILMEEISRQSNRQFLTAIIEVLLAENSSEDKMREFHDILMLEILEIRMSQVEQPSQDLEKCVNCLLQVYRASESLKKRNKCIELLTTISAQHLSHLSQNQRLLVQSYRQSLSQQQEMLSL